MRCFRVSGGLAVAAGFVALSAGAVELAKVNGRALSDSDLRAALGGMNEGQRESVLHDANSRRGLLIQLIDQEILIQEGEKAKLDQDKEYQQALAAFRRQYLAGRVLERNLAPKLTDKAARKYYEGHKSRYSTDRVHVHHILAPDEPTARELLKQAKAQGADFQELAEQKSRDPSAKNNRGDLGMISWDSGFVEEFKTAAFRGAEGEIVGPVKTAFGYHLVKIVEKKLGKILGYDEVELRVRRDLELDLTQTFIGKLKQQAKIQIDDKAVDSLN